ncbi:orotate phosphoribosyltransferase-like protein [Halococcoides cellulosivorans]|uniref:Transcriptional regulator GfcR n=1 Tax=Halococcoides cellulosivorans TaxID=1679096 RepID=A0A2R4X160_9EURY|nr:orotate phosphoribosyltransferase-like protein [Halococcoides cellulosivorans]AWB27530.1 orotate phosphoribosyltransferase-like protein [Halococcoides cellulosivorans]
MKSIDELIEGAGDLAGRGLSRGEVADELNVSRETAEWLIARSDAGETTAAQRSGPSPTDVHVDWSTLGSDSERLHYIGAAMADVIRDSVDAESVDITVGIGKSGGPLATTISETLETDLGVYMPSKYYHDEEGRTGTFSRNFGGVDDATCVIVDDNIDTGQTMTETVDEIRARGGDPVAAIVLTDKRGDDAISGVPVYSMIDILNVSE